jgi:hypothetical protein
MNDVEARWESHDVMAPGWHGYDPASVGLGAVGQHMHSEFAVEQHLLVDLFGGSSCDDLARSCARPLPFAARQPNSVQTRIRVMGNGKKAECSSRIRMPLHLHQSCTPTSLFLDALLVPSPLKGMFIAELLPISTLSFLLGLLYGKQQRRQDASVAAHDHTHASESLAPCVNRVRGRHRQR